MPVNSLHERCFFSVSGQQNLMITAESYKWKILLNFYSYKHSFVFHEEIVILYVLHLLFAIGVKFILFVLDVFDTLSDVQYKSHHSKLHTSRSPACIDTWGQILNSQHQFLSCMLKRLKCLIKCHGSTIECVTETFCYNYSNVSNLK